MTDALVASVLITLHGPVLAITSWCVFRLLRAPLPEFLYHNFSAQLQLLCSQIGVYRLQVAEARSGHRYFSPAFRLQF